MARNGSAGSKMSAAFDLAAPGGAKIQDSSQWFAVDPTPVFVVRLDGAVLDLNEGSRRLLKAGTAVTFRGGQLSFGDDEAQSCFTAALARLTSGAEAALSVVLRCDDGRWRRLDLLRNAGVPKDRVFVTLRAEPKREGVIGPVIEGFGLSVAEGNVLLHVAQGLAPKSIAAKLKVSPHTVRAHLRSLYVKMHVRGMQELIREYTRLIT